MSKWKWWEIPLGIATGGGTTYGHLIADGLKAAGTKMGSSFGNNMANTTSAQLAMNQQMYDYAFNKEMEASNTAVQRHVADLQAAGLNPALAASGSGASVPSAGAAQIDNSMNSAYISFLNSLTNTVLRGAFSLAGSAVKVAASS